MLASSTATAIRSHWVISRIFGELSMQESTASVVYLLVHFCMQFFSGSFSDRNFIDPLLLRLLLLFGWLCFWFGFVLFLGLVFLDSDFFFDFAFGQSSEVRRSSELPRDRFQLLGAGIDDEWSVGGKITALVNRARGRCRVEHTHWQRNNRCGFL